MASQSHGPLKKERIPMPFMDKNALAINLINVENYKQQKLTFSLAWINVSMKNDTDSCVAMHVTSVCINSVCGIWPHICHIKL